MGARLREDVIASLRLSVARDWWVGADLLAGVAGYVVWVAGSAALGTQVASLADYPVAPDGTPTMPVLALAAFLWLVLPAAAVVARVHSRLMNIRGNVEQDYRLDRPAALLVPPALLIGAIAGMGVGLGRFDPLLLVALVPATLYLLVRTIAYSYRVYTVSHPLGMYSAAFATVVVQAAVLLLYLGRTTEYDALVAGTVDAIGLPVDPFATVSLGPLAGPAAILAAVGLPVGLVAAYVVVQFLAGLALRIRDPTIRPGRVRTGQRYPPWLDVASSGEGTSGGAAGKATPASKSSGSGGSDTTGDDSTTSSSGSATPAAGTGSGGTATASTTQSSDPAGSTAGSTSAADDDGEAADEAVESVSHTKVFTPPGGDDDPLGDWSFEDRDCSDCGATVPADADACPACGADSP